jgi:predicted RNA-binding Zn-ribbon protein involved in translation (DUF1610 family)
VTRTVARTARKIHHCADCGSRIEPGEHYLSHVASPNDPEVGNETWWRLKECARCATRYGRAKLLPRAAAGTAAEPA